MSDAIPPADAGSSPQLDAAAARRASAAFRAALAEAVLPFRLGQQELFSDEDEQFIQHAVDRHLYKPLLPNAGSQERKWLELLYKFAADETLVVNIKAMCWRYAKALEACLPAQEYIKRRHADGSTSWLTLPGCYYSRKNAPTFKTNKNLFEALTDLKRNSRKDAEKKWLAEFLLDGEPAPVSNFKMECLYLLRSASGEVTRLVRLVNTKGEFSEGREIGGADLLPNEMYAGSEKFRQWVGSRGNFTWGGTGGAANTELQSLQWDVTQMAAYRVVKLIEYCGWHEIKSDVAADETETGRKALRGLWFYNECAISADGKEWILPDGDGIFWYEGVGYALAHKGREAEYIHGRPKMRPKLKLEAVKMETGDWQPQAAEMWKFENRFGGFFREVLHRFYETAGGMEGWLSVGAVLAYAAAPEIFQLRNQFPSLWVSGQMGSGKTTYASWLMSFQGFNVPSGMSVISKSVTAVGVMCQLENYSNLLLWLDEFRQTDVDPAKAAILRDTYGRQLAGKWSPDGIQRKIRTAALVSGESTTSDAATRSRYPHVLISESKRLAQHYDWFQDHHELFFFFWRHLMENRPRFVEMVLKLIDQWMAHADLKVIPARDRFTHAVAYAALAAATVMFESHDPAEVELFRQFLVRHTQASAVDVSSDVNVNVFTENLVTAYVAGEIPSDLFRVESTLAEDEFGQPWNRYKLFIEPKGCLTALQIYLRKAGQNVTLREKDLRDQMANSPYWIKPENPKNPIKRRFGKVGSKVTKTAWGIEVDLHPMGKQPVTEDVLLAALKPDNEKRVGEFGQIFRDGDPRRGALFSIIEGVEKYEARKLLDAGEE